VTTPRPQTPDSSTAASRPAAGTHVLVVDDDPQIRQTIQWCLEDEGITVETAGDGRQAVDQAIASRPSLIILDMGLPRLSGEEVADALLDHYGDSRPPIVVLTAAGHAAEKARRCAAVAHLPKPFELDDLASIVLTHAEKP
jgi:two-component system, OmpR family, KDP operon response regulator KdpE